MNQQEIDRLKSENEQLKQELKQNAKAKNTELVESLIQQGRILPANKEQVTELLNYALDYDNGEALNFNEGESLSSKLKDYLNGIPIIIHLNREISAEENLEYSENLEYAQNTPKELINLDKKIRSYMKLNNVDYKTAFNAIHHTGAN